MATNLRALEASSEREDDPARTIVPRLKAAGGDLGRIHIIESVIRGDDHEALPSLKADIGRIEDAAASLEIAA